MVSDSSLAEFIASNPDARELKRALAVQMTLLGFKQRMIQAVLGVQSGFISTWKQRYLSEGVECLRLGYKGSQPYLSANQRVQINAWLATQAQPSVALLASYIQTQFGVVFQSSQSYYDILSPARYSWKKTQARLPGADRPQCIDTREAIKKLAAHKAALEDGSASAFFIDESHLHWDDACGYSWGRQDQRLEVSLENGRQRPTYYGALDVVKGSFLMPSYPKANAQHTVDFLRYLQQRRPGQKLLIFWDGVSYHHQHTMRDFLETIHADLLPHQWKICCTRLAPYAPRENPVEDTWLKSKTFVHTQALWTTCFEQVKDLFVKGIRQKKYFQFPKLKQYTESLK